MHIRERIFKVDMANEFNGMLRDIPLAAAGEHMSCACCCDRFTLCQPIFFMAIPAVGNRYSAGGPPMGPLYSRWAMTILLGNWKSLSVWYLDDGTIRGSEKVLAVVAKLVEDLRGVSLALNPKKFELSILNHRKEEEIQTSGGFRVFTKAQGSACCKVSSWEPPSLKRFSVAIREKRDYLERLVSKLKIENHKAFILLKNSFALPKLKYILRASPAHSHMEDSKRLDDVLAAALAAVTNLRIGENPFA